MNLPTEQQMRNIVVESFTNIVRINLLNVYNVFVGDVPKDDQSYAYVYFLGKYPNYVGHTGNPVKRAEDHFKDSPIEWIAFIDDVRYSAGGSVRRARILEGKWARHLCWKFKDELKIYPPYLMSRTYKVCAADLRDLSCVTEATFDFWLGFKNKHARWRLLQDFESYENRVLNYTRQLTPATSWVEDGVASIRAW